MGAKKDKHYRVIAGQLYARFIYIDDQGKRRERHLKAESKMHARELYERMAREYQDRGAAVVDAGRMTFKELADKFAEDKLQPAVYAGDTRVSGMRSWKTQRGFLKVLIEYFGARRITTITYHDLTAFRTKRFATKTHRGADRSVANVNRELSLLRSVFNYAKRAGWLARSPFEMGEGLISLADEKRRDRLLTREEEQRLLEVCEGRRDHLRPIVIAAMDTAMRKGELLQLTWNDVNLEAGVITVRSSTTKTRRGRSIGITSRLSAELRRLWESSPKDPDALVFGITDDVKRSFGTACRKAGIVDLHFHDLRHLGTTRMIQAGMPPAEVMKITGHTRFETFARYLNVDGSGARRAAMMLDSLHEREASQR
jgi:integrase